MVAMPAIKIAQAKETNEQIFDRLTSGKYPLLKKIGYCESGFRMVPNTQGSSAYGIFQIMKVHSWRGDRYSVEGNIKIAIQLFNEQSTRPWESSRSCWGR